MMLRAVMVVVMTLVVVLSMMMRLEWLFSRCYPLENVAIADGKRLFSERSHEGIRGHRNGTRNDHQDAH